MIFDTRLKSSRSKLKSLGVQSFLYKQQAMTFSHYDTSQFTVEKITPHLFVAPTTKCEQT